MKSSAIEFAVRIQSEIEALTRDQYHNRTGQAKILREEWYPISRLGLHLQRPGLKIEIEVHGPGGRVDATISESGFREREFYVEVSCTYDYEESLRAELMVNCGSVPGAGEIHRGKDGKIVAELSGVDIGYHEERDARLLANRFKEKCLTSYPANTVLVLVYEDVTTTGWRYWQRIIDLMEGHGCDFQGCQFLSVFILNTCTNELQQVK